VVVTASTVPDGNAGAESGPGRVDFSCLDAFRAFAATGVVATHAAFQTGRSVYGPFSAALARLDVGVAVFFVISGFLLFHPYAWAAASGTPAPSLRGYLWRRGLRILPAYWLAVAACLLLIPANRAIAGPADWAGYATLTQIYRYGWPRLGLTQTWSLCTEVAFYLALPLLAGAVLGRGSAFGRAPWSGRRALGRLAVLPVVAVGWAVVVGAVGTRSGLVGNWLPGFLDWFAVGMALAVVSVHLQTRSPAADSRWRVAEQLGTAPVTCWAVALGLFALASTPLAGPRAFEAPPDVWAVVLKNLLYAGTAAFLLLPAIFGAGPGTLRRRVLASRPARWLGRISYGIFLWHLLVLQGVTAVLGRPPFTGSWLQVFALTWLGGVAVATVSYYLVERPALRLKGRVPVGREPRPWPGRPANGRHRRGHGHPGDGSQAAELGDGRAPGVLVGGPPVQGEQQPGGAEPGDHPGPDGGVPPSPGDDRPEQRDEQQLEPDRDRPADQR
jgi:peptidoglycan/LPS O-acetylase OafA/YrhL